MEPSNGLSMTRNSPRGNPQAYSTDFRKKGALPFGKGDVTLLPKDAARIRNLSAGGTRESGAQCFEQVGAVAVPGGAVHAGEAATRRRRVLP